MKNKAKSKPVPYCKGRTFQILVQPSFRFAILILIVTNISFQNIDKKVHGPSILSEQDTLFLDIEPSTKMTIGQRFELFKNGKNFSTEESTSHIGVTLREIMISSSYFKNCEHLQIVKEKQPNIYEILALCELTILKRFDIEFKPHDIKEKVKILNKASAKFKYMQHCFKPKFSSVNKVYSIICAYMANPREKLAIFLLDNDFKEL